MKNYHKCLLIRILLLLNIAATMLMFFQINKNSDILIGIDEKLPEWEIEVVEE